MAELCLRADVEKLSDLHAFIESRLAAAGCPAPFINQLLLASEEVFVNVCSYAYPTGSGTVTVTFDLTCGKPVQALLTFTDCGIPFDPLGHPDPDVTFSADERAGGGLGIYIVKQTMDELKYEYKNGKNTLFLRKALPERSRSVD